MSFSEAKFQQEK